MRVHPPIGALLAVAAFTLAGTGEAATNTVLQVGVPTERLCVQRKAVPFVIKNVSAGTINVALTVERQGASGEWQFVQESIATPCPSKAARVWRLSPGQEDRAAWSAKLAGSCFRSGRYRVIAMVNSGATVGDASSPYRRVEGPEFLLEQCDR